MESEHRWIEHNEGWDVLWKKYFSSKNNGFWLMWEKNCVLIILIAYLIIYIHYFLLQKELSKSGILPDHLIQLFVFPVVLILTCRVHTESGRQHMANRKSSWWRTRDGWWSLGRGPSNVWAALRSFDSSTLGGTSSCQPLERLCISHWFFTERRRCRRFRRPGDCSASEIASNREIYQKPWHFYLLPSENLCPKEQAKKNHPNQS